MFSPVPYQGVGNSVPQESKLPLPLLLRSNALKRIWARGRGLRISRLGVGWKSSSKPSDPIPNPYSIQKKESIEEHDSLLHVPRPPNSRIFAFGERRHLDPRCETQKLPLTTLRSRILKLRSASPKQGAVT